MATTVTISGPSTEAIKRQVTRDDKDSWIHFCKGATVATVATLAFYVFPRVEGPIRAAYAAAHKTYTATLPILQNLTAIAVDTAKTAYTTLLHYAPPRTIWQFGQENPKLTAGLILAGATAIKYPRQTLSVITQTVSGVARGSLRTAQWMINHPKTILFAGLPVAALACMTYKNPDTARELVLDFHAGLGTEI